MKFIIIYVEINLVVTQFFYQMAKKRSAGVFSSKADEDIIFGLGIWKEEELENDEEDAIEYWTETLAAQHK